MHPKVKEQGTMKIFKEGEVLSTYKLDGSKVENRYEVRDLKVGGMSLVYLCFDLEQKRPIVLKTLKEEYREKSYNRFMKEVILWRELPPHRNIVYAEDVIGVQEGKHLEYYLVLEFILGVKGIGSSLRDWITRKKLDLEKILNFSIQFCEGMSFAYERAGIVHLDIKPENILIDRGEVVKITDFGIAKSLLGQSEENFLETTLNVPVSNSFAYTSSGVFVGTIPYSSPEQCLNSKVIDTTSDIYSFGAVIYEMLTGRWLFDVNTALEFLYCHIYEKPRNPRKFNHNVPRFLDSIVMKCLEKDPKKRYPNFRALKEDLLKAYKKVTGEEFIYEIKSEEGLINKLERKVETLSKLSEFEEAARYAEKLLKLDPKNPIGWEAKANGYLTGWGPDCPEDQTECLERALKCYEKCQEYAPDTPGIWYQKGQVLEMMGRYEEAIRCLDKALEEDPKDPWAWYLKGNCLMRLNFLEMALECYDKALEIYPYFYLVWDSKAECLEKLRQEEEAAECKRKSEIFSSEFSDEYGGLPPHF